MAWLQHLPAEESVKEQADAIGTEAVSCYDLNITAVQPVAGETDCWTVFAQEGVFRLYLKEQTEYTRALLQVWEYLQAQGFSRLAALQMTRDGDIAVNMNDKLAFLIEALEGRPGELALQSDSVGWDAAWLSSTSCPRASIYWWIPQTNLSWQSRV